MTCKKALFSMLMAGVMFTPAIALAQSNDIMNRLNRMENEIQTLNRALYKGEAPPVPQSPVMSSQNDETLVRIQQMESDLRGLTGRVEQQTYDIEQLKQQIEAMSYQMQQASVREPTPVVPQSQENLRPDDVYPNQGGALTADEMAAQPAASGAAAPASPEGAMPPQPNQMGMQTATPTMPDGSDPTALYEASYTKIQSGDYPQAEKGFSDFIKKYPDHKLAANAYYWLGESYYARKQYDKATRIFAQSYQKFPKGPKGPDNLLKLGLSLSAEGKQKDACVALGQLSKEYPTAAPAVMQSADAERQKLGC